MTKVGSGGLRSAITILYPVTTTASDGEIVVSSWATLVATFAEVKNVEGREYWSAAKQVGEELKWFRLRYREDVTTAMRIAFGSSTYAIRELTSAVNEDTRMLGVRI